MSAQYLPDYFEVQFILIGLKTKCVSPPTTFCEGTFKRNDKACSSKDMDSTYPLL